MQGVLRVKVVAEEASYLFLLIAFLAEVFTPTSHFGAAHSMFFGCKVFFDLRFCKNMIVSDLFTSSETDGPAIIVSDTKL